MLEFTHITCENIENPIGLDIPQPQFSWQFKSDLRNTLQTAFHFQVSTNYEDFVQEMVWDTHKTQSSKSVYIQYEGLQLQSCTRYYFRVKIWDNHNQESDWSNLQYFETAFMDSKEWQANWISPNFEEDIDSAKPGYYFRKSFTIKQNIKKARIYASALGLYEINLNGKKIGDELFTPGQTDYNFTVQYQTYELDENIFNDKNILTISLGEGWYRGRFQMRVRNGWGTIGAIIFQMHILYEDDTEEIIISDDSWKVNTGPILLSDIYDGEIYDARLEDKRNLVEYDDSEWRGVSIYNDYPKSRLAISLGEKVKKIEELRAKEIIITPKGEIVIDMGQNMVGWVRLQVKGNPGQTIQLDHGEVLVKGNFYRKNLRSAKAQLIYTCKSNNIEIFEPHFTFFGFRYVRISNYDPNLINLDNITGIVIHSDMKPTGNFECSNELINRLQHNIQWGQKGNFLDVPTDCPQRNERVGWTGDAQVFARTACYNMDTERFFTKWLKDLRYSQKENGGIPNFFPSTRKTSSGTAGWGDVATVLPWQLYLVTGNKKILEEQYESMKKWVEYERSAAQIRNWKNKRHFRKYPQLWNYIWDTGHHYGDWLAPGENIFLKKSRLKLITTAYYAYSTQILIKAAKILGKEKDIQEYSDLYQKIKEAFQKIFMQPDGRIIRGNQTAYVLALEFGLYPAEFQDKAAQFLAEDVQKHKNHLTTGFLGTPQLCFALSNHNQLNTAYDLLLQTTCPSWLYPIKYGDATTIWERWDAIRPSGRPNNPVMTSFNHYAYGAIGDWLYRVVVGIDTDENTAGYKKILIKPNPTSNLEYATGIYHSRFGPIKSSWWKLAKKMKYEIEIPPNTIAQVVILNATSENITESKIPLTQISEVINIKQNETSVIFDIGSGKYIFEVEN